MPCQIQIKKLLEEKVKDMSNDGLKSTIEHAKKVEKEVNNFFNSNVVYFTQEGDYINREITISDELIKTYFNNELELEQKADLQRKETGNWDINEEGDIIPLDTYFQKNEETITIDDPKDFNDLFNSIESIKSTLELLNKPIFNDLMFNEYYLTESNKDKFKDVFIKTGLNEKSIDFIVDFIEKNNLQRTKLSEVIGKIKQNLIFKSKGLNYYNAILTQQADNELDKFLINFLKDKLSVNVVKNSINHYGSAMAVADILNKVILINNQNLKTLPEETGHFFFELLGQQNKLQLDLLNHVKKWEGYSMVYEKYKTIYVTINENGKTNIDEEKIKREAVGQAIGEAIVRNYKAKKGDIFFSLLQEAVDFIKNLLNSIGMFNFEGVVDEIAKDILNQDISKIKQIKDDNYQKRRVKDTLANYPELQQMIDNFTSMGAKLTGSMGYRDQGDLFRPLDEDVHDLDFRVYKEAFGDNIENFLNKVKERYPQMKVRTHENGKEMMWTTKSKNLALLINIDGLYIDLFFYNYNSNNNKSSVSWYESFKEKYQMGRPKDMNDILRWANFNPINIADSTQPFVYYQLKENNNLGINKRLSAYEESIKITNEGKSKILTKLDVEKEKIKEKLLSLGFKQDNNSFNFNVNSYISFKEKLKNIENLNLDVSTTKQADIYGIVVKLKNTDSTLELKKQGELPFTPIEIKNAIKNEQFLNEVSDNVFEGLSNEEKQLLKNKIENGDYDLNCKI